MRISIFLAPNLLERMEKKFHPLTPYWRQIGVRGWKKNSILSLLLAPNLCEWMEKKPSSYLATLHVANIGLGIT
jgi:hypothetical protein